MEYKGKREIKVDDAADAFYARAVSAILDDMELDFDLTVVDYADEEAIELTIDGEEWVLCYDQDEEGFHFNLITPEEFDDNYYRYAPYDDDDNLDEFDFEDDDWHSSFDEGEPDEQEFQGDRIIQGYDDVSIFHITTLSTVLNGAGIDFDLATIEQADDNRMTVDVDGEKIVFAEQKKDGNRILAILDPEDGEDPGGSDSRIIPFKRK